LGLSCIERLDLIERLAPAVEVPETVICEVRGGIRWDRSATAGVVWAERFCVPDRPLPVTVECWNLDPGESQVISQCLHGKRWAVLDDQAARRCVRSLGLLMIGSLGIVLRAKEQGIIPAARSVLQSLVEAGMFAAEDLLERTLAAIGEAD
jgi:predicted nucleic acid-binding protein